MCKDLVYNNNLETEDEYKTNLQMISQAEPIIYDLVQRSALPDTLTKHELDKFDENNHEPDRYGFNYKYKTEIGLAGCTTGIVDVEIGVLHTCRYTYPALNGCASITRVPNPDIPKEYYKRMKEALLIDFIPSFGRMRTSINTDGYGNITSEFVMSLTLPLSLVKVTPETVAEFERILLMPFAYNYSYIEELLLTGKSNRDLLVRMK